MNIQEAAARAAAARTLLDAAKAAKDRADDQLDEAMLAFHKETGSRTVDASLPATGEGLGTVSVVNPDKKAVVEDPAAFREWVRAVAPSELVSQIIVEVNAAFTRALLRDMGKRGEATWAGPQTGGELVPVPGVKMVQPDPYVRMTVPDDARARVIDAYRDGLLDVTDLIPALAAPVAALPAAPPATESSE
ncbi:hypothetical protein [Streptomyces chilikensis]|uniref:Uncharacterized protein n=1 Tax=Streptomyces chilikensis TaxID=1194079 RepID=A0ABV3EJ60_9ACTN